MKRTLTIRAKSWRAWLACGATVLTPTLATFAASQTWTNAPVSALWNNTNNWVARGLPGVLNQTGNTVNGDVATFNSPIPGSGIGGAANPITPDNATTNNTSGPRSREISGITFDTVNCGAYVINSPSPVNLATNSPQTGVLWVSHNGSIQITGAVTNSQSIIEPVYVILPSSTAGAFNLVNNSSNANVTLNINSITHGGANSRATTFILGGSNSALNSVTNLSEGVGNGTGGITKQGTGTWLLTGPNTFPNGSSIKVNEGKLIVQDPNVFGLSGTATVTSNGVLQIEGVSLVTPSVTLAKTGTVRMNGTAMLNGIVVDSAVGNSPTVANTSASDTLTIGNAANKVTGGATDSILHSSGPGTNVLVSGNTNIFKWSVDSGTLVIQDPAALGAGANVNVGAGAVLDITALGANPFQPSTAGIGGSGTGTAIGSTAATINAASGAVVDLVGGGVKSLTLVSKPTLFTGDTSHPALLINNAGLTLGGNSFTVTNAAASPLGAGTYTLITVSGGAIIDGGNYSVIVYGSGLIANASASIQVSGQNVNLVVSPYVAKNLVWKGNLSGTWDTSTANWLNGASSTAYTSSDNVTFNATGAGQPLVTLASTLAPGSVTVDTTSGDYSFTGAGQISGTSSLVKNGTGTLTLGTANSYAGGTTVNNGVLKAGVANALPSLNGDVQIAASATLDVNSFSQTVNGVSGAGTIDTVSGGTPVITVGNNGDSGTFTGTIKNTAGTLGITKIGVGTEVLSGNNSYSGATTINLGTIQATSQNALGGANNAGVVDNGVLDVATPNLAINNLTGNGSVANNSTTTTNFVTLSGTNTTTFNGFLWDGTGGGGIGLRVLGGNVTLASQTSTHTGGTFVGTNVTFGLANAPAGLTGPLVVSNNATLGLNGGSNPPSTPSTVTSDNGATVNFTSGALGKIWSSAFYGNATCTNILLNNVTFSSTNVFANFPGTVSLQSPAGNQIRFSVAVGAISHCDPTTFDFVNQNQLICNAGQTVTLGQIKGGDFSGAGIYGSRNAALCTWIIGTKNLDSTFEGRIDGPNALVKAGTGKLTLDGAEVVTNTDSATFTNYLNSTRLSYTGNTTVSNGTLAIVVPNSLTNSPAITLAGNSAVLDASKMGTILSQMDETLTVTNTVLVTNGILEVLSGQTLSGFGSILASSVVADAGSTLNPGNPDGAIGTGTTTGVLAVNTSVQINGAVNLRLNRTNSVIADELTASSFTINPSATLTVTNVGSSFQGGEVFHLFNHAVNFTPANVILPTVSSPLSITNKLAVDGTIAILGSLVNTNPAPITFGVANGVLTMSWPADHLGWTLQVQTNSLNVGVSNNWHDIPGTASVISTNLPVSATDPAVFYRLHYQY